MSDPAYDALCCYTLAHGDAAFIHQHVVDAQIAQQADERTKPIGITFALVGLYLHVEHGVSGRDVQRAHMLLARQKQPWPTFALPPTRGAITPADVMQAPEGPERDRAIDDWCAAVWREYAATARTTIAELLRRHELERRFPSQQ
ncbi:MAG TPA: DUF5946 family protein [Thermoanaerobaculia bacterium]|nr:DUF5946 family protein [Thermoanaerobaculia bacterium]